MEAGTPPDGQSILVLAAVLLARDAVAADGEAVGVANEMEDRLLWVGVKTLVEGT